VIGAGTADDGLWTELKPAPWGPKVAPGPLVAGAAVVAVPDLARLSLAGRQAAVSTIGADVAHLERDGLSVAWRPDARWLAACSRADIHRVSRHLLDRFALRIDVSGLPAEIGHLPVLPVPPARPTPTFPAEAAAMVTELVDHGGARRALALSRTARALAMQRGEAAVTPESVAAAGQLMGLINSIPQGEPELEADRKTEADQRRGIAHLATNVQRVDVALPHAATALPPASVAASGRTTMPYPEDNDAADQDGPEPLRPPGRQAIQPGNSGVSIGSMPARDLRDIALIPTMMAALRAQGRRCPNHFRQQGSPHGLHLKATDLQSHRRADTNGHFAVLLIDHTCRASWHELLRAYLQWLYSVRARICVVEVGMAGSDAELRATMFTTRNLLDARLADAMRRPRGRATPLAHGLALAARALQRNAVSNDHLQFLAITDGRGNVPLTASQTGLLNLPVGAEGVEDTLRMAERIRSMRAVRSLVLDPDSNPGSSLSHRLAAALGASFQGPNR